MTFEEQFSSFDWKNGIVINFSKYPELIDLMKTHCLDKKKVIEAIDKFYYSFNRTDTKFELAVDKLKKELGLE